MKLVTTIHTFWILLISEEKKKLKNVTMDMISGGCEN